MSKKRAVGLPPAMKSTVEPTNGKVKPVTVEQSVIRCEMPVVVGVEGYCRKRVDLKLNAANATKLKQITQGLENQDAKLQNGRYVSSPMHALTWMIENAE